MGREGRREGGRAREKGEGEGERGGRGGEGEEGFWGQGSNQYGVQGG